MFIWEIYEHTYECMHAQLHVTLQPHGLDSLPDSVVHELFQAKILKWVATSYSRDSS